MTRAAFEVTLSDGRTVVLAELGLSEVLHAMRAAGDAPEVLIRLECVRRSLRKVDDTPLTYPAVVGALVKQYFPRTRDRIRLGAAWGKIHEPSDEDIAQVVASMTPRAGEAGELWAVKLPGDREVVIAEQDEEVFGAALKRAKGAGKGQDLQALAGTVEALRVAVRQAAGRGVTPDELAGAGWDRLFNLRDTLLLARAWQEIHLGGAEEDLGEPKPVAGT